MEPRNYESGASESAPIAPAEPSTGYPTGGNPGTGAPATKPGPFWFYKIGESLRRIIVAAGLTPDDDDLDLLDQAINSKVAAKASQAEVDAGTNDTKFVSPLKLRWGFSVSLSTSGYIALPSWLGGLIFQWVRGAPMAGNSEVSQEITLPLSFPNSGLCAITTVYSPSSIHDHGYDILSIGTNSITVRMNYYASSAATSTPMIFAVGH